MEMFAIFKVFIVVLLGTLRLSKMKMYFASQCQEPITQ
jgi:hypothetical protein